jgi:hypothetical protein
MADTKISALPASTTPLAGTEVVPLVQGGVTKQVSVANLTAGRAVSTGALSVVAGNATLDNAFSLSGKLAAGSPVSMMRRNSSDQVAIDEDGYGAVIGFGGRYNFAGGGDFTVGVGNVVIGTSGKGIDFSATPGTGTSELLADYEEGTWTPVATGVTVNSGTPVWSGIYTKVGRTVVATWRLTGGANVSIAVGNRLTLPFASSDIAWGSYGNNSSSAFIGGLQTVGADVYFGTASTVAAAGGTIVFQV